MNSILTRYKKRRIKARSEKILNILEKIKNVFKKNNIKYWLEGGTLLGAVRENRLLPWDKDADLVIYYQETDKLNKIVSDLKKEKIKCKLVKYDRDAKCFKKGDIRKIKVDTPLKKGIRKIEIFLLKKLNDTYCYGIRYKRDYLLIKIPEKFCKNTIEKKVLNSIYSLPEDYEGYLSHRYGREWRIPDQNFGKKELFKRSRT